MERNERLILGIDPGFGRMGYAILKASGSDLHLRCDYDPGGAVLPATPAAHL